MEFQFTRPRGARHGRRPGIGGLGVSIHAPTRGATGQVQRPKAGVSVSIHAPTRGATPQGGHAGGDLGFNSRAHAGRDV